MKTILMSVRVTEAEKKLIDQAALAESERTGYKISRAAWIKKVLREASK